MSKTNKEQKQDMAENMEENEQVSTYIQGDVLLSNDGKTSTKKQEDVINQGHIAELATMTFTSREDLLNVVKTFFFKQGYGLKIKSSRKDKYVTVGCDRGGHYRDRINVPPEQRKRNTTTRLINCPFEIKGKKDNENSWRLEVENSSHNHEASKDMSGHPSARVLSKDEVHTMDELTKSGAPPRQIMSYLRRKNPGLKAVARNIYNTKAKILKETIGGRSNIQVLFEELGKGGFTFDVMKDKDDQLTHVFFTHPSSLQLNKSYSNVFVMDCTYKTNKYNMPLLEVIGITSFNTSFYSCFIFLKSEGLDDYIWALNSFSRALGENCQPEVIVTDRELALMNAIEIVFPKAANILCIWHIEKNICANCKTYFEEQKDWESFLDAWNGVVYSTSIETFERTWVDFEHTYDGKKNILGYIEKTWLPYKKKFISAWTEEYLHFGNRASSRAEGAHSKLKKYLLVSTGDLRSVKEKMCQLIENDIQEIKTKIESEKLQVPLNCGIPFFKEVVTHVSLFAMKQLHKQFELACNEENFSICSGTFSGTMGLPCAHMMRSWTRKVIPLESIHSQWRIDSRSSMFDNAIGGNEFGDLLSKLNDSYHHWSVGEKLRARNKLCEVVDESNSMIFEPIIQQSKGRPKMKNKSSTKRNPSQFEIMEKSKRGRNKM